VLQSFRHILLVSR